MICKSFLPVCGLAFHFFSTVYHSANIFNVDEVQFVFFYFIYYAFGVIFENFLLNPGCHCNFLLCFLVEVSVSSLTVKYTHHFELIFMYGV